MRASHIEPIHSSPSTIRDSVPEMRGEPSPRTVARVLWVWASRRSRTLAASSGAAASNSDQLGHDAAACPSRKPAGRAPASMRLIPCRKIREGMELARDVRPARPARAAAAHRPAALRVATRARARGRARSVRIEADLGRDITSSSCSRPRRAPVGRATAARSTRARFRCAPAPGSACGRRVARRGATRSAAAFSSSPRPRAARGRLEPRRLEAPPQRPGRRARAAARPPRVDQGGLDDFRGRQRYDRFGDRLRELGVGLLVHDVGKLAVPPEVLTSPPRLPRGDGRDARPPRGRASSCWRRRSVDARRCGRDP